MGDIGWGVHHSDKNVNSGSIFSFDVVCVGSPVIMLATKKVKEQVQGILSSIRDHRKSIEKQGRSPTPADILVNI